MTLFRTQLAGTACDVGNPKVPTGVNSGNSPLLSLGPFALQSVFGDVDQFSKGGRICGRDVRQNLAVKGNFGGLQTFHKAAISRAGGAGGRIDADLPEGTEVSFFGFAVPEGVGPSMIQRVGSITVEFGAAHPKAFGGFNSADSAFSGSGGVSNSHDKSRDGG